MITGRIKAHGNNRFPGFHPDVNFNANIIVLFSEFNDRRRNETTSNNRVFIGDTILQINRYYRWCYQRKGKNRDMFRVTSVKDNWLVQPSNRRKSLIYKSESLISFWSEVSRRWRRSVDKGGDGLENSRKRGCGDDSGCHNLTGEFNKAYRSSSLPGAKCQYVWAAEWYTSGVLRKIEESPRGENRVGPFYHASRSSALVSSRRIADQSHETLFLRESRRDRINDESRDVSRRVSASCGSPNAFPTISATSDHRLRATQLRRMTLLRRERKTSR